MSKPSLQIKRKIFHYRTGTLPYQKHAVRFKMSTFSVHSVSKQIVLSIFSQGVDIQSSRVLSLNAIMLPAGSSWKPSAKALWQVVKSIWMPAVLPVWPNKTFKFLSILITGQFPAGFLMLVRLLEIDSPLVALMPFWSLPTYWKTEIANHSSFAPGGTLKTTQQRYTQSSRAQCQQEGDTPHWGLLLRCMAWTPIRGL